MHEIRMDIETRARRPLKGPKSVGVYKYVECPDFKIVLLTFEVDNSGVFVQIDLYKEKLPPYFVSALSDPKVIKKAFNANFERVCFMKELGIYLDPSQWMCTMVKAAMLGYPFDLDTVTKTLGLGKMKDSKGEACIRYFSSPCKPTATNGGRTWNLPEHNPTKWEEYKGYNTQDVVAEKAVDEETAWFIVPEKEHFIWVLDQYMNDLGIGVDRELVENSITLYDSHVQNILAEAMSLTGLNNPNSQKQLLAWINEELDEEVPDLKADTVKGLFEKSDDPTFLRVVSIKQQLSKSSIKKFHKILMCLCDDDRMRGQVQYGGANRTLRWAGRLTQIQNYPDTEIFNIEYVRDLVRKRDLEKLMFFYGNNVPLVLSKVVRTAIIAGKGKVLVPVDYSSIELIVAAWVAGETWVIEEYKGAGKVYERAASRMYGIPLEMVTKALRKIGKVASLACQFGGGAGAIKNSDKEGSIAEDDYERIKKEWRKANPHIVSYWYDMEKAAFAALEGRVTNFKYGIQVGYEHGALYIKVPSGRKNYYVGPYVGVNRFGKDGLFHYGINDKKKWGKLDTYGGKLFQNTVQAVARDCIAESFIRLHKAGYKVLFTVHDEVVVEADKREGVMQDIMKIMTAPISWAPGLPLKAEGFETQFYKK